LYAVIGDFSSPPLSMLPGNIRTPLKGALVSVTPISF
jgi:hypothetical protein